VEDIRPEVSRMFCRAPCPHVHSQGSPRPRVLKKTPIRDESYTGVQAFFVKELTDKRLKDGTYKREFKGKDEMVFFHSTTPNNGSSRAISKL
jgi:hypothetical protein